MAGVTGEPLPPVSAVSVLDDDAGAPADAVWTLHGVTSDVRYTRRAELDALAREQSGLGRAKATLAALVPISKSAAWWALAHDERRALLEETSHHIAVGREYLPAVARRLHHGRDVGGTFDFLTWFEYAPQHAAAFEELVGRLRRTPEWAFVEREVDIRLSRRER